MTEEEKKIVIKLYPECPECGYEMVPLSGEEGIFDTWSCVNKNCRYCIDK